MRAPSLNVTTMTQLKFKEASKGTIAIETSRIEKRSDESPFLEVVKWAHIIEIIKVLFVIFCKKNVTPK